jgi:hypothetical protein
LTYIEDLPDDPELAFAELVSRYSDTLALAVGRPFYSDHYTDCMEYLVKVTSAARACELDILAKWQVFGYDDDFEHQFLLFRSEVNHYLNIIRIKHTRRSNANGVRLTPHEKEVLHGYIEKMRQIIASSNLPDDRKERIYEVLTSLALEVSRDRTRFERVTECVMKLSGLSKHAAEEGVAPWAKLLLPFFGVLDEAKQDERQRLPKPEERKTLPPPNDPNVYSTSSADDVPF